MSNKIIEEKLKSLLEALSSHESESCKDEDEKLNKLIDEGIDKFVTDLQCWINKNGVNRHEKINLVSNITANLLVHTLFNMAISFDFSESRVKGIFESMMEQIRKQFESNSKEKFNDSRPSR